MSDILIKNMEKPKSCFECRFDCIQRSEDGNEHFCFVTRSFIAKHSFSESMKNFVLGNCPLVEVEPYDRLVEKYRLYNHLENKYCEGCTKDCDGSCTVEKMLDDIDDFPTVAEAST